jgi:prepilin peptidase CpaA
MEKCVGNLLDVDGMNQLALIPFFVVACVGCTVAVTDVRAFRVPNAITYPFALAGLAYHGLTPGGWGLGMSLLGMAVGFAVLLFLHLLGAVGAGDVKLMAGVGAWLGASLAIYLFAIAAAATAVYSVVVLIRRQGLYGIIVTTYIQMMQIGALFRHLGEEERVEAVVKRPDCRKRLVPFAAMVALGGIVMLVYACWSQSL